MATRRGRSTSPSKRKESGLAYNDPHANDSFLPVDTRQIEAFGRTAYTTASQLISYNPSDPSSHDPYRHAISSMHKSLRRPALQRSVFSFAKANPTQILRRIGTSEIEHRAIAYVPDEMLKDVPESSSVFSLLEGFKASLPESDDDAADAAKKRRRHGRGRKMIEDEKQGPAQLVEIRRTKAKLDHRLEMMGIRKNMCASEIREIDGKIMNLNVMRKVVLDRLAGLEQEENELEQEIQDMAVKVEEIEERLEADTALAAESEAPMDVPEQTKEIEEEEEPPGFMSESIYQKLPKESPKKRRKTLNRRISMPILHEHLEPGSRIREMQAHNDIISALDFDAPWGTMVTAALDDTVRVWDLNAGRCMGLLEGHLSSVRCLQVEDNLVATGSMDASIRLWDLSQADYDPSAASNNINSKPADDGEDMEADGDGFFTPVSSSEADTKPDASFEMPSSNSMENCALFTLQAHVDEVTALNFRGNTLVSGSADKTLRQWDLERGRCVQTLDVLWAAAQASTINPSAHGGSAGGTSTPNTANEGGWWKPAAGRVMGAEADFVGALQVFDAALAAGTADGVVRLWDLRSGTVHRSLVGHTGPVTSLQFDDAFLVTGSKDRSIRIWDLRTGGIYDAFAYEQPITSMQFDTRRIVAAAGEDVVKVYDKTDGRQWDCGAGVADTDRSEAKSSIVEHVRIKDGYLIEGRRDGVVGVWSC